MTWRKMAGSPFETYKHEAVASNGMVATNHPLGSAAGHGDAGYGRERDGRGCGFGVFALSVVEPMMVGIFGAGIHQLL